MEGPRPPIVPAPVERLPGARRAAVLMAALGPERAANVMQRMDEEAIESLSMEMARLSSVGAETTESVFGELAAEAGEGQGTVSGGLDFARGVIERALDPERATDLLGRLESASETRPFEFLRRVPPERIAASQRFAIAANGTKHAFRPPGGADRRAEVHHRLGEIARPVPRHHLFDMQPDFALGFR